MSGREDRDPIETFETLRQELSLYNPKLLELKAAVVANKMDVKGRRKYSG